MKKILIYTLPLLLGLLMAVGCKEEKVVKYDDTPKVYFFKGMDASVFPPFEQDDHVNFSFTNAPQQETYDIGICAYIMGHPADEPRTVTFVQTNADEEDAAVPGVHYVPFDDPAQAARMVIPAGEVKAFIPVTLKRDESLLKDIVTLKLKIVENSFFDVGYNDQLEYTVTFTSKYVEPKEWDYFWSMFFGEWGEKKMWFLVEVCGIRADTFDDLAEHPLYEIYWQTAILKLEEYNNDPANEDAPLTEDDGTPVEIPHELYF